MRFLILLIALVNQPTTHTDMWIEPIAAPTTVPDVRFCYPDFEKSDMEPIPCPPIEIQGAIGLGTSSTRKTLRVVSPLSEGTYEHKPKGIPKRI